MNLSGHNEKMESSGESRGEQGISLTVATSRQFKLNDSLVLSSCLLLAWLPLKP
jgi:hypothetical protein